MRFERSGGVATVIGSLPFARVADAADFVLDRLPGLPAAPAVGLDPGRLEPGALEPELRAALEGFLARLTGRVEPLVMSLTGPVTLGLALVEAGSHPSAAASVARTAVADTGRWMLDQARHRVPAAPVLLFLEESALVHSLHPAFPVAPADVADRIAASVADLPGAGVVGLAVPARADWSRLLRTGIGALAAPLSAHVERAGSELVEFLERDGFIAWGAVPTDEPLGPSSDRLWDRLAGIWAELAQAGTDPRALREHSIITPAGSLAGFGRTQLEQVVRLTQQLAERARALPAPERLRPVT